VKTAVSGYDPRPSGPSCPVANELLQALEAGWLPSTYAHEGDDVIQRSGIENAQKRVSLAIVIVYLKHIGEHLVVKHARRRWSNRMCTFCIIRLVARVTPEVLDPSGKLWVGTRTLEDV
jgi:hypothetical protein